MTVLLNLNLPFKKITQGKIRHIYELSNDKLLMVTTDRISAFDLVLPNGIPYKGIVLNNLSLFWFEKLKDIIQNHIVMSDISEYPKDIQKYQDELQERSVIVKKAKPIRIECVVRGYLAGSGWEEYKEDSEVSGIKLPRGLLECSKLPEPIFTPATKVIDGHDKNITIEEMREIIGDSSTEKLMKLSLQIYNKAYSYAEKKGIIIADTKLEFGFYKDDIILIDEVFTPDSSRFWLKESYKPGISQNSFDKQYVRDYLKSINWDKKPPAPTLPNNIIESTSKRYIQIYQKITECSFSFFR